MAIAGRNGSLGSGQAGRNRVAWSGHAGVSPVGSGRSGRVGCFASPARMSVEPR